MSDMNQTIQVAKQMGKLLTGRLTGRQHFAKACDLLAGVAPNSIVVLDFHGTQYISASWINAMILPLITFAADEKNDFYVVVTNFPQLSLDDLQLVAEQNRLPVLVVSGDDSNVGSIFGTLDPGQRETLEMVVSRGEVTGVALASDKDGKGLSGAAWNNRLRDLNLKRLLRRRREGREQIYSPVVSEVQING
jgi:hypothetical protein